MVDIRYNEDRIAVRMYVASPGGASTRKHGSVGPRAGLYRVTALYVAHRSVETLLATWTFSSVPE